MAEPDNDIPVVPDLELVSNKVLMEALFSRYDHVVFVGLRDAVKGAEDNRYDYDYRGKEIQCLGLCALMQNIIPTGEELTNDEI